MTKIILFVIHIFCIFFLFFFLLYINIYILTIVKNAFFYVALLHHPQLKALYSVAYEDKHQPDLWWLDSPLDLVWKMWRYVSRTHFFFHFFAN